MSIRAELASAYSRTKVRPPLNPLMHRPRLEQCLRSMPDVRLWLVQAPAGYGKSSLLQSWAAALADGGDISWLSLDASDREPELFASHLLRSLEEAGCPVDPSLFRLLEIEGSASARMVVITAMNGLVERDRPLHMFIDDAQHLKHTPSVQCLELLLTAGPSALKLIVATREDIGLQIGRLRAHGLAAEIRTEDLRFDLKEMTAFLAREGHTGLPDDDLLLAHSRTEGWAVGLKLFSMMLKNKRDYGPALRGFSGELRQIADFFAEDVFSCQPPELQDFLLRTSVLDWLSPALCDDVLDIDNSRELIDRCEAAGLFLTSLDDTRSAYAYHQLFAEHLRWRLYERSRGEAERLCRRASEWLFAHGRQIEAFDCALKGRDPMRAAEMLDSSCDYLWAHGHQHTIQRLAASIPPHIQALYPRIMLTLAWRLTAQWKIEEARHLLTVSRARLDEMERAGADAAFIRHQRWLALHRECQIAQTSYDLSALERIAKQLLEESTEAVPPYLMASVYNSLQYARREQFKLDDIERLEAQGRECCIKTGSNHSLIFASVHAGPSHWLKGQADRAIALLTQALAVATEWAGADAPIASVPAMPLAAIRYERNEIAEAAELIAAHMPVATVAGFVEQLLAGWITKSRLLRLHGDVGGAVAALEEAVDFGARSDLERLRTVATAEHVRLLLRIGRPDEAMRLAQRRGIHEPRAAGRLRFTTMDSAVALAWCRLAAARDRVAEALPIARQWRSFVAAAQAVQSAVEWDIALAELLAAAGEKLAARRTLAQAIARAAPCRMIRAFLDQGEPIALLLMQLSSEAPTASGEGDAFLAVLIAEARAQGLVAAAEQRPCDQEVDDALTGQMNSREIQILGLAGEGMLNREIGERLGLTEGTVKWYLQQVFDKVGIRDRVRAAQKVRRLGLMR